MESLQDKKGREQAQATGQELLAKISEGATLEAIADTAGVELMDEGYVTRNAMGVEQDVLSALFAFGKPEAGKPVIEGVSETDGDYTIIEFSDVQVENQDQNQQSTEATIQALNEAGANYDLQAMIKSLAEDASVIRTPVAELQ